VNCVALSSGQLALGPAPPNGEMAGRYGKKLLVNIRWKQKCVATIGLGCKLPGLPHTTDMGEWKVQVSFKIRPDLRRELEEAALRERRTLGNFGRLLVESAFERHKEAGSTEKLPDSKFGRKETIHRRFSDSVPLTAVPPKRLSQFEPPFPR
jgi:hypothetical protein